MKIDHHLKKLARFEATLSKLDYEDDYETMIEDFMLASAHLINAALHQINALREDKDVKHNQLFGFLKRELPFGEDSSEIADLIQQLEQLRPSHVYGKGENGNTAKKAQEIFLQIKQKCNNILGEKK